MTCAHVRLLGPCFKTGRVEDRPIRHWPEASRTVPTLPTLAVGRALTKQSTPVVTSKDGRRVIERRQHFLGPPTSTTNELGYNTAGTEAVGHLPSDRLLAARRAGRGNRPEESAPVRPETHAKALALQLSKTPARPVPNGLVESPGSTYCGSTRLPLSGFTYS
ncbi:hypothetical protein ACJMK2_044778 [Sinanodonta woodiana]|uniref:Uncharacterized protein n=1 Tax=Sinanodonta woodiana TaxID=1069815 RepID=A0ABD3T2P7_SINWO